MSHTFQHLQAVVFDWAGTTVDFGSLAPTIVFQEIFRQRGVPITAAQAREPMGRAKRDHIASIIAMPAVAAAWVDKYARACDEADIDSMYADFLPLQKATLLQHCQVIEGVTDLCHWLRAHALKIGSSTGYTRELMEQVVVPFAAGQGYEPDVVLTADDAPRGRPAPYLLFEAAKQLDVYPLWTIVKVDDTVAGIQAGRNAGCWTIGVSRTGNEVGLSAGEFDALSHEEQAALLTRARTHLEAAGAHAVVETVAEIRPVLAQFEKRLAAGELPMGPSDDPWRSIHPASRSAEP